MAHKGNLTHWPFGGQIRASQIQRSAWHQTRFQYYLHFLREY